LPQLFPERELRKRAQLIAKSAEKLLDELARGRWRFLPAALSKGL
jgi:hypothetical protein